tara:strand:+ start:152 stop:961 length:810 start_codon:yes stop_codon:yes gene_type:complete
MKTNISILLAILISIVGFSQTATTNLQVQNTSDTKAWIQWEETNDTSLHLVNYFKILYNIVGDTAVLQKQKTYDYNQFPIVRMRLQDLNPNTQYEFKIKTVFTDGSSNNYSDLSYFTTGSTCPNIGNLTAYGSTPTRATFDWNAINPYQFVRIKLREDYTGAQWIKVGGMGVNYPATSKNKNGLISGVTYRAQARTWCGSVVGLPYKSDSWTTLIYWTQPSNSARLSQSNNIEVVKITDLLGRKTKIVPNKILIYVYSDGSVEKKMIRK